MNQPSPTSVLKKPNAGRYEVAGASCPACTGTKFRKVRDGVREAPTLIVRSCEQCGLQFIEDPNFAQSINLEKYYADEYREKHGSHGRHPLSAKIRHEEWTPKMQNNFDALSPCLFEGANVLEIGCSAGSMMKRIAEKGCSVTGLEYNLDDVAYAQSQGLNVLVGDIDTLEGQQFDVICSFAVIEHVGKPLEFLQAMKPYLRPNGTVVLSTPNSEEGYLMAWDLPGYEDFWYRLPHLWYFNMENIVQLANRAGLTGEAFTSQSYNVANFMHWFHGNGPMATAIEGQTDEVELVPETSYLKIMNRVYADFDRSWRSVLEQHHMGDILYFVGGHD